MLSLVACLSYSLFPDLFTNICVANDKQIKPENGGRPLQGVNNYMIQFKTLVVNIFTHWVRTLQARLHNFPASRLRCSSLQNAVCGLLTPCREAGKLHTHTCPTAVSRLKETYISGDRVFDGHFLKVQRDLVSLPDGETTHREYIKHPGAVVILPVFADGSVLLERQFRYPLNRIFIEFPAGKIDPNEDPLVCAKRELLEETGYTAKTWQFVCTIHNAIAYSDEHLEIYLAQDLTPGQSKLDEGEFLEVYSASLSELMEGVRLGQVTDVKTIIGAFWLDKIQSGQWPTKTL